MVTTAARKPRQTPPARERAVYSWRNHLGYIAERGRGFEAPDQHRRSLGVHRDMRSAANAVETAAAPLPTKRDGLAALRAAGRVRREAPP
jgi:hypothetical protein